MKVNTNSNDRWILDQLIGIRMLERELAAALHKPPAAGTDRLHRRIRQLNAWVDAVDRSLSARRPAA